MEAMQWNDENNRGLLGRGMKREPVITTKEFWTRFDIELIDDLTKKELRNACEARGLGRALAGEQRTVDRTEEQERGQVLHLPRGGDHGAGPAGQHGAHEVGPGVVTCDAAPGR